MEDQETDDFENWRSFPQDLRECIKKPAQNVTFCIYFVAIVVVCGGLSIFFAFTKEVCGVAAFQNKSQTTNAMATYAFALCAASLAEILLASKEKRPLRMFFFALAAGGAFVAFWSQIVSSWWASTIFAVPGVVIGWLLWWVANRDNPSLTDKLPPTNAATGGESTDQPAGNLKGLKT